MSMAMKKYSNCYTRVKKEAKGRKVREVAGFVLPDSAKSSIQESPEGDDLGSVEARIKDGFIPDEEISVEHMLSGAISMSQLRACMDPLEFAVMKVDVEAYGPKTLGRNLRLS